MAGGAPACLAGMPKAAAVTEALALYRPNLVQVVINAKNDSNQLLKSAEAPGEIIRATSGSAA